MSVLDTPIKQYYASRASEYDEVYEKPERQADIVALRAWLESLFVGRRVLDIACGTGYWTQSIVQVVAELVGVDSADSTLEIARSRIRQPKVSFVVGDAYALAGDLGVFDAAFLGFWLSHVPRSRRRAFVEHVGSRLEPGARIVFVDNCYVEGSNHPISRYDDDGNSYQTRSLANGSMHEVMKNFPSESQLHEMIAGIGCNALYKKLDYYYGFCYENVSP